MASPRKEPIRTPWIWAVFGVLFVLINPWYFPASFSQPLFCGIPAWAVIIVGASLALSAFCHYVLVYHWQIDDADEAVERSDAE